MLILDLPQISASLALKEKKILFLWSSVLMVGFVACYCRFLYTTYVQGCSDTWASFNAATNI